MARKSTAPRIGEQSAKFYTSVFQSLNWGLEFTADAFPVLYRRTLHDLKGRFNKGELSLMIDVFNATALMPGLAGQHLNASVADGIDLDHLDEKWEIEKEFVTRDREAGNIIEAFPSRVDAENAIIKYEATDKHNDTYSPEFYEIHERFPLNTKIAALTIFQSACLEIWANGFWYRADAPDPVGKDFDEWLAQLL